MVGMLLLDKRGERDACKCLCKLACVYVGMCVLWHVTCDKISKLWLEKKKKKYQTHLYFMLSEWIQPKKEYFLLTGSRSRRCCSGSAASPAWWCWAECTTQWGSLPVHTEGDTHFIYILCRHFMFNLFNFLYETPLRSWMTNLFHPKIIKDIHVVPRSTSKPDKKKNTQKHTIRTERFTL